jgi:hypothetical protein
MSDPNPQPGQRPAYVGTWQLRSILFRTGVVVSLLAVASVAGGAATGEWYSLGAAVCWIVLAVLAFRKHHLLETADRQIPTGRQARWVLIGLGLFLLGVLIIVLGQALMH